MTGRQVIVRYPDGLHYVRTLNAEGYIESSRRATFRDIAQATLRGDIPFMDVNRAGVLA